MEDGRTLGVYADSVAQLHQSPWRLVAACTGAGAGLQHMLWSVPGSSGTILEMAMPYSRHGLEDFLGHQPDRFVSEETAKYMAAAAYSRARELAVRDGLSLDSIMGLGLTATVSTGRPKKGQRRAWICLRTPRRFHTRMLAFDDIFDRLSEGSLCDKAALELILEVTVGLPDSLIPVKRTYGLRYESERISAQPSVESVSGGDGLFLPQGDHVDVSLLDPRKHILFPGSFNPLHYGHEQVAAAAKRLTGKRVVFAISADHPVKGKLSHGEIALRLRQFAWRHLAMVGHGDGLYVEKARRFPGFDIIIGADALLGLLDNRHYVELYRDRIANLANEQDRTVYGQNQHWLALRDIQELKSRFLVSGRVMDGQYLDPIEIINNRVYWPFRELFVPISGGADISSSALRARSG
jgi:hypothetical protein